MKKLLLTLAVAVLGFAGASAASYDVFTSETESWTGDANGYTSTVTVDGKNFTLTTAKAASTTNLVNPSTNTDKEIRIYKGSTLTIASSDFEFTNVVLTATGSKYIVDVAVSEGWTVTSDKANLTYTLTSATPQKTVTFDATGGQVRVKHISVADEVAKPAEAASVKSVKETIALATDTKVKVDYALTVGFVHNSNVFCCDEAGNFIQIYNENKLKIGDVIPAGWEATYKLFNNVTPELTDCTLPAEVTEGTFSPKEVAATDLTKDLVNSVVMLKNVEIAEATPAGQSNFTAKVGETELSLRNNYSLASVPAGTYDLTLVVTIYNDAVSLYVASYNTGEEPAGPVAVKNVKETIALSSGTPIKVDYELTVGFVNVKNVFACDADGDFIQIYNDNELKVGDKIPAGWEATYTLFNGVTPEIEKATLPTEITEGTFTPKAVAVADLTKDLVNNVVMLKDVVISAATPAGQSNFTAKVGETEVTLRNHYKLASVEAGIYEVTLVVTVNKEGVVSLYVISYNKTGEAPEEPVVPVEPTAVKSVAETIAVADGTLVKVDYTLTVAWVYANNVFCCDPDGDFIQIYNKNQLKVGDVIPAGWQATYKLYNNTTPELTECALPEEVTAGTFTAKEVPAEDITAKLVNNVVLIKNVTLDAATPAASESDNEKKNFTGTVGDVTLNLRNHYKVESVPAGVYDITVVVSLNNGEPSLYVINFAKASGISNITVDADAPAVYYNLNGVRVDNPANGIYIRIQSGKAEKVIL